MCAAPDLMAPGPSLAASFKWKQNIDLRARVRRNIFRELEKPSASFLHQIYLSPIREQAYNHYNQICFRTQWAMDQQQVQVDFDKLSDNDKRDLQQSLNNEMQKSKIQECAAVLSLLPTLSPFSVVPLLLLHVRVFSENCLICLPSPKFSAATLP